MTNVLRAPAMMLSGFIAAIMVCAGSNLVEASGVGVARGERKSDAALEENAKGPAGEAAAAANSDPAQRPLISPPTASSGVDPIPAAPLGEAPMIPTWKPGTPFKERGDLKQSDGDGR